MKQLLNDLYWESIQEMEKIKKSKLSLSERIALERAVTKLETMKKILNISQVTFS